MTVKKDTGESDNLFNAKDYLKLSFELVNNKLSSIDDKATKTEAGLQGVIRTINQMQLINAGHYSDCPNTEDLTLLEKRIDKEMIIIDKKIAKYEFMITYWRVFAISGAITVIGLIFSGYVAFAKIDEILNNTEHNAKSRQNELFEKSIPIPNNPISSSHTIR